MRGSRRLWWLVLIVVIPLIAIYHWNPNSELVRRCNLNDRKDPAELEYVAHARCRMECRGVSEEWVEKVYKKGRVNCKKSGPVRGDMRWALEMDDDIGDRIRVVVEEENGKHIVITVIRLGREDRCSCS